MTDEVNQAEESYAELMSQAQAMMARAEQIRKAQKAGVIAEIKEKMKAFGITAEELGSVGTPRKNAAGTKAKSEPKYKGPNGEPWSGGPGRRPDWVKAALAAGEDIEQYRIA